MVDEMCLDGFDRTCYPRIIGRKKTDQGHHKQAGVQMFASVVLNKRVHVRIEAFPANLLMNGIAKFFPSGDLGIEPSLSCRLYQAVATATQAIILECTKCLRGPRISQIPSSGCSHPVSRNLQHRGEATSLRECSGGPSPASRGLKKSIDHFTKNIQLILL